MHAADQPQPRILLVDDDAFLLRSVSRLLSARGYRVVTAHGGADGVAALEGDRDFDLVLFDMDMPVVNGPEFLRVVYERHAELRGRFVVMSGAVDTSEVRALTAEGSCRALAKPFRPDEIKALLTPR